MSDDDAQTRAAVEIFTDGACSGNPGPGGWGAVLRYAEIERELSGGDKATTNNRMELTAAISALEYFPEGAAIEMRCDSQYVVKSVTEWMPGWKRRGWRTATGPVKNVDLMERLDALATRGAAAVEIAAELHELERAVAGLLGTAGLPASAVPQQRAAPAGEWTTTGAVR